MNEKTTVKILSFLVLAAVVFIFIQKNMMANEDSLKTNTNKGIQFKQITLEEALKQAEKENKPVFLDAYASWCYPCKLMTKNTFGNSKVAEYFNKHFINIKMDMEKGEGPKVARRLNVMAYPTVYFIASDGTVLKKAVGYLRAGELLQIAKTLP